MSFLVDTNVISEAAKPHPNPLVMAFMHEPDEDRLFIGVGTLAELRRGVALKTGGRVKSALDAWLRVDLPERFSGRIVDITVSVADLWGEMMADAKQRGIARTQWMDSSPRPPRQSSNRSRGVRIGSIHIFTQSMCATLLEVSCIMIGY